MLILTRTDVQQLLDAATCIDAVENAFRLHAGKATFGQGILGTHVDGGGFHIKVAGMGGTPSYYATKVNANFPDNPSRWGLPTIQGAVILFDAPKGTPLAVMDSMEITTLRTAAASAIAAKYLAREDARVLSIIGCGVQGRGHFFALTQVRAFDRVLVHDADFTKAESFALRLSEDAGIDVEPVATARHAAIAGDVIATCTAGREQLLAAGELQPGTFLAAVGADNESKRELDPALLAASVVIVDSLEQCATIGELHHALAADLMTAADVRSQLADVVAGLRPGRLSSDEVIIFDSTGTALQDVAAAAVVYERALVAGRGKTISLAS